MHIDLGLHCLLTLKPRKVELLSQATTFVAFIKQLLIQNDLCILGEITHVFDTNGFTTAICLAESHLCAHTWPEHQCLTLDIHLCNYSKNNEPTVTIIKDAVIKYFDAEVIAHTNIKR